MPTRTTNKTKQDLLDEIADLKQQIANMEKYKAYKDMSDEFKLIYDAFKDSGFSDDQAFDLLKASIETATKMAMR